MTCVSVPGYFISEAAWNGLINKRITNKVYLTCFKSLIYVAQKEKEKSKCSKTMEKNLKFVSAIFNEIFIFHQMIVL